MTIEPLDCMDRGESNHGNWHPRSNSVNLKVEVSTSVDITDCNVNHWLVVALVASVVVTALTVFFIY